MKNNSSFFVRDKDYIGIPDYKIVSRLNPGAYTIARDMQGTTHFNAFDIKFDELVDLPNTEFDIVNKEIEHFLTDECRKSFKENGFLYKRSSLLYGAPGTGKTSCVNRVSQRIIQNNGIVLFNPAPELLEEAYNILNDIQPEVVTLVIFEELDELLKRHESKLLDILDGETQKQNVVYMATTNHIDMIPARIRRPGRFSTIQEVKFPVPATREFYLKRKLKKEWFCDEEINNWVESTQGFSIDELKETVQAVLCLNQKLPDVINRIRLNKGIAETPKTEYEKLNAMAYQLQALHNPAFCTDRYCETCNESDDDDCEEIEECNIGES